MPRSVTDAQLAQYLAARLSPVQRHRLDAALARSPELQARLDALKREEETVNAVRDSSAIRLPEPEEERIRVQALRAMTERIG